MGKKSSTFKLILAAMFLALCIVLPLLGGQFQPLMKKISPMHFPVMICAFVCGWQYAAAVGFIAPLLRSVMFGMPPLMPTAAAMAFEMAAYGLVIGLIDQTLPKKNSSIYVSMIVGMLAGRIVWGLVSIPLWGMVSKQFTMAAFLAAGFIDAVPAIVLQLLIIPVVIMALKKAKFI